MTRVTKAPDERRNELILTAQHLFFTKGYDKTSVKDIVKTVGVAKGTFYHYFDSKTAVLEAIVNTLADESITIMKRIVDDDTLSALEKWHQAFDSMSSWKVAQKEEMLAITQLLLREDNIPLMYKLEEEIPKRASVEIARIIAQGVEEGVFNTRYPQETAEMMFGLNLAIRKNIADIILEPEKYDNPVAIVRQKFTAVQTAIERILDAPSGSMQFIDEETLAAWFEE